MSEQRYYWACAECGAGGWTLDPDDTAEAKAAHTCPEES